MRAFAVVLATTVAASPSEKFAEFKEKYNKQYGSNAEELQRFKIFTDNLERAEKMAHMDESAVYGHLSPLADLDEFEFGSMNTLMVTPKTLQEHESKAVSLTGDKAPDAYDWRDKGAVTDVKNQQQCGSCWAFATVANIEGQNYIQNSALISLSEQELVDCDTNDNGCGGGLPENAYKDLISNDMGLETEKAYSYTAENGSCHAKKSLEKVFLSSWVAISSQEDQMAAALVKYGPLAIGINAGPMQLYMGGIADPMFCNPAALDHGVTLVAYGSESSKPFWTIKNSWGSSWGESGYYRIIRGKGKCGLNRMVTSAIVKKKSATDSIFV